MVKSRSSDSEVAGSSPTRRANNLEHIIYTHGAQANSALHPSGVGRSTGLSSWDKAGCVHLCRMDGNTV